MQSFSRGIFSFFCSTKLVQPFKSYGQSKIEKGKICDRTKSLECYLSKSASSRGADSKAAAQQENSNQGCRTFFSYDFPLFPFQTSSVKPTRHLFCLFKRIEIGFTPHNFGFHFNLHTTSCKNNFLLLIFLHHLSSFLNFDLFPPPYAATATLGSCPAAQHCYPATLNRHPGS